MHIISLKCGYREGGVGVKRILMVVLVVALAFSVAGCKKISEKIGEKVGEEIAGRAVGGDVDVDGDSVTIQTDDGEVSIQGDTGEIPEDFPSDFPIYDGVKVDSSSKMAGETDATFYINLLSDDAVNDIYEWYKTELADEGWKITSDFKNSGSDGDSAMIAVEKDTTTGTITMSTADKGSEIGIILGVKTN